MWWSDHFWWVLRLDGSLAGQLGICGSTELEFGIVGVQVWVIGSTRFQVRKVLLSGFGFWQELVPEFGQRWALGCWLVSLGFGGEGHDLGGVGVLVWVGVWVLQDP